MADISKVKIQDNTYDIKDATARARNIPSGGTTGQILSKASGNDYDAEWTNPSGGGTWGSIIGDISNQTDLQSALNGKLNKSGDTMTGNLEIDGNNAHIAIQSDIDEDVTPVELLSAKPVVWYDKDDNMIGHIALEQNTSNSLCLKLGIRRLIGNEWLWKQIRYNVDTEGDTYVEADDLYTANTLGPDAITLSNNTITEVCDIPLKRGAYILLLTCGFASNSTGMRKIGLKGPDDNWPYAYNSTVRAHDGSAFLTLTVPLTVESSQATYKFVAQQTSGGKLSATPRVVYMKIA